MAGLDGVHREAEKARQWVLSSAGHLVVCVRNREGGEDQGPKQGKPGTWLLGLLCAAETGDTGGGEMSKQRELEGGKEVAPFRPVCNQYLVAAEARGWTSTSRANSQIENPTTHSPTLTEMEEVPAPLACVSEMEDSNPTWLGSVPSTSAVAGEVPTDDPKPVACRRSSYKAERQRDRQRDRETDRETDLAIFEEEMHTISLYVLIVPSIWYNYVL